MSVYETWLNDSVELSKTMLNNFTFVACNNPNNTRRGGVGLFYNTGLLLKIRYDLAIDESIVALPFPTDHSNLWTS